MIKQLVLLVTTLILTIGCSAPNAGRYSQAKDSIPQRLPTLLEMTDPVPQAERLSSGGNKPYSLFGQYYTPLVQATEHREAGIASWYGNKFHGHLTSNGETYNMFAMTAAHKTLPLPSYVKVTNLDNQKTAIVRVNDRGPFHRDRIIDLSYSAASKLGMLQQGTARVQLELLQSPAMLAQTGTQTDTAEQCYIQVLASSDSNRLNQLQQQILQQQALPSEIKSGSGIFRLLVGPTASKQQAQQWLQQLKAGAFPDAYFFDSRQCS
ncbi:septal ring lytic transglycosylase RlpA family protein [Rheinheimera sp. YQF-2]|jgi:rare lipoprotein A|uniref:Endolytic peptidoglycan transglycosylase RlpA n=1 Tax=Rheinheimera lutimaris TaxID=2740584 RepID=A0A7Y5ASV7_9GAMM|nr:septal ring lytic transglycosylase RlpA family protein [Rheinheimera lutimaris]NRQ43684.1 septal ring lytic transglycosylase RlpA family protein [Rheinheimera lutimaris]